MRISHRSPVARSLLGKRIGEVATVLAPGGRFSMRILSIADVAEKVNFQGQRARQVFFRRFRTVDERTSFGYTA